VGEGWPNAFGTCEYQKLSTYSTNLLHEAKCVNNPCITLNA